MVLHPVGERAELSVGSSVDVVGTVLHKDSPLVGEGKAQVRSVHLLGDDNVCPRARQLQQDVVGRRCSEIDQVPRPHELADPHRRQPPYQFVGGIQGPHAADPHEPLVKTRRFHLPPHRLDRSQHATSGGEGGMVNPLLCSSDAQLLLVVKVHTDRLPRPLRQRQPAPAVLPVRVAAIKDDLAVLAGPRHLLLARVAGSSLVLRHHQPSLVSQRHHPRHV
mmetsp:Transcript_19442/g.64405  ORF Transcript_19442/g.64405 Transcript_19442/m.64405 type:complete len:220 (-) Transcript_19442:1686-2345(-)